MRDARFKLQLQPRLNPQGHFTACPLRAEALRPRDCLSPAQRKAKPQGYSVYEAPKDGGAAAARSPGVVKDGAEAAARRPPGPGRRRWRPRAPGEPGSPRSVQGRPPRPLLPRWAPRSVTREDSVRSESASSATTAARTARGVGDSRTRLA